MVTILIVADFLRPRLTLFPSDETKSDFDRSCGVMVVALKKKSHNISFTPNPLRFYAIVFSFASLIFLGAIISINQTFGQDSAV